MEVNEIKTALINQRKVNLPGNLYYNTQIEFAYNTNHIEGSTITSDETASIYDTGTIIAEKDKIVVLGFSIGTGVANYVTSEKDPHGLILVAPYDRALSLYNNAINII